MADESAASSPAAITALAEATGAALQADVARALALLGRVPAEQFGGADGAFRAGMFERFGRDTEGVDDDALSDTLARRVLAAYRGYWRAALVRPGDRAGAEARLLRRLCTLLGCMDSADFDAIEPVLAARLGGRGFHCLQGLTGPLRELMLWARQVERVYQVALPEGTHATRVLLLDGFASLGWSDYATCGRRGAGGWASADALYAVVPRYGSLDGEEFRVTFLGHETQHFVDLARFPGMASWELEFRAKLVELAQARETRAKILRKFTEDQGDDPASPHAYANKRVLTTLGRRLNLSDGADLDSVDIARLQAAAASALQDDTRIRLAA